MANEKKNEIRTKKLENDRTRLLQTTSAHTTISCISPEPIQHHESRPERPENVRRVLEVEADEPDQDEEGDGEDDVDDELVVD